MKTIRTLIILALLILLVLLTRCVLPSRHSPTPPLTLTDLKLPSLDPKAGGEKTGTVLYPSKVATYLTGVTDLQKSCLANAYDVVGMAWVDPTPGRGGRSSTRELALSLLGFAEAQAAASTNIRSGGLTLKSDTDQKELDFNELFKVPATDLISGEQEVTLLIVDLFKPFTPVKIKDEATVQTLNVNHGNLVLAHTIRVLQVGGFEIEPGSAVPQDNTASRLNLTRTVGGIKQVIHIETMQVPGEYLVPRVFPSSTFNPDITPQGQDQNVMYDLTNLGSDIDNFARQRELNNSSRPLVINMSFAVLNCDVLREYHTIRDYFDAQGQRYTLNMFVSDTAKATGATEEAVQRAMTQIPDNHPMVPWLQASAPARATVVAASGNFSFKVQTFPAHAPQVIGVGATSWGSKTKSDWSDPGDVLSVGEWFKLPGKTLWDDCQNLNICVFADLKGLSEADALTRYPHLSYRGTSFASPSVAAYLAIRRTAATDNCWSTSNPLGFAFLNKNANSYFDADLGINKACP